MLQKLQEFNEERIYLTKHDYPKFPDNLSYTEVTLIYPLERKSVGYQISDEGISPRFKFREDISKEELRKILEDPQNSIKTINMNKDQFYNLYSFTLLYDKMLSSIFEAEDKFRKECHNLRDQAKELGSRLFKLFPELDKF